MIGEDPDAPDVFADSTSGMAQITSSLNDAIQEICMVTGSHKRRWYIPIQEDMAHLKMDNGKQLEA